MKIQIYCKQCGKKFTSKHRDGTFCSERCCNKFWNRIHPRTKYWRSYSSKKYRTNAKFRKRILANVRKFEKKLGETELNRRQRIYRANHLKRKRALHS